MTGNQPILRSESSTSSSSMSSQSDCGANGVFVRTSNKSDGDPQMNQLRYENQNLKKELEKARDTIKQLKTDESALRQQAQTFKEDFDSERRDRERAQSKIASLEMELEIVKRELHQYNLREMQDIHQRRQAAMDYHRQQYMAKHPESLYQCDGEHSRNMEEGEDEID